MPTEPDNRTEKHHQFLQAFASRVLNILEDSEDWSADTLDAIAAASFELGLADVDDLGRFRTGMKNRNYTVIFIDSHMDLNVDWTEADSPDEAISNVAGARGLDEGWMFDPIAIQGHVAALPVTRDYR